MTLCNKGYAKRLYLLLLVSWHFPAKILQNLDTSHLLFPHKHSEGVHRKIGGNFSACPCQKVKAVITERARQS
ncbi:hypothetical protein SCO11_06555 [Legionella pneumophila serogroup 1]|uniref:hypothetical protein n=1 Tax=Legionella pneumophila TaxID=446 RepID=UPI0001E3CB50|nr:hypothetical protein [Legionella pneumophila]AMV15064.1 hypothetical protein ULM_24000 [Legionella pneumophila]ANN93217.1 hypothetical protein A9P85_11540 [Legionella pneumophila]MCZ4680237.1 hypothetical protein [Legionella pneumophila]MCZ4702419.1 hypothetical protein [Legionella pneumophila]MCZ4749924.1 hypothetical protein [Legionella pneumophila]